MIYRLLNAISILDRMLFMMPRVLRIALYLFCVSTAIYILEYGFAAYFKNRMPGNPVGILLFAGRYGLWFVKGGGYNDYSKLIDVAVAFISPLILVRLIRYVYCAIAFALSRSLKIIGYWVRAKLTLVMTKILPSQSSKEIQKLEVDARDEKK